MITLATILLAVPHSLLHQEMKKLAITTSGLYSLSVGKIRAICLPVPHYPSSIAIVAKWTNSWPSAMTWKLL